MLLFVCVKYRSRQALVGNLVRRMARSEGTVGEWNEILSRAFALDERYELMPVGWK